MRLTNVISAAVVLSGAATAIPQNQDQKSPRDINDGHGSGWWRWTGEGRQRKGSHNGGGWGGGGGAGYGDGNGNGDGGGWIPYDGSNPTAAASSSGSNPTGTAPIVYMSLTGTPSAASLTPYSNTTVLSCAQNITSIVTITASVTRTTYVTTIGTLVISSGFTSTSAGNSTGIYTLSTFISPSASSGFATISNNGFANSTSSFGTFYTSTASLDTFTSTIPTGTVTIFSTTTIPASTNSTATLITSSSSPVSNSSSSGSVPVRPSSSSSITSSLSYSAAAISSTSSSSSSSMFFVSAIPVSTATGTDLLHPTSTVSVTTTITSSIASGTPNPAAVLCGLHGMPVGDYFLAEFVENKADQPVTLEGCYQFCAGVYGIDQGCQSYDFYPEPGTGAPRCDLYGGSVADSLGRIDNYDPNLWFDLACGDPALLGY